MENKQLVLEKNGIISKTLTKHTKEKIAIMFPGHGSQYKGMFEDFKDKAFIDSMDVADFEYKKLTGNSLLSKIGSIDVNKPEVMQPAIFAVNVSMFKSLKAKGIKADILCGHSFGEFAALCCAGLFDLRDGIKMSLVRAQILSRARSEIDGLMLSVKLSYRDSLIQNYIKNVGTSNLSVAIINDDQHVVVSGTRIEVIKLKSFLRKNHVESIILPIPFPFHSGLLKAQEEQLELKLEEFKFSKPTEQFEVYSTILSRFYEPDDFLKLPKILAQQLITPFDFRTAVRNISENGVNTFVESGAGYILSNLVMKNLSRDKDPKIVVNTNSKKEDSNFTFDKAISKLQINSNQEVGVMTHLLDESTVYKIQKLTGYPQTIIRNNASQFGLSDVEETFAVPKDIARKVFTLIKQSKLNDATLFESKPKDNNAIISIIKKIIENVTGYPEDVLDEDADLEADLGIDSVKQADIFSEIYKEFNIHSEMTEKPDSLDSIRSLLNYVTNNTKGSRIQEVDNKLKKTAEQANENSTHNVVSNIKKIIQKETGYPIEVIEEDADLEADLGIDSVKQTEIISKVAEYYRIAEQSIQNIELGSVKSIADFVIKILGSKEDVEKSVGKVKPLRMNKSLDIDRIVQIIAEQTGYPKDVLDINADLEADLGIDSVKRTDIMSTIAREQRAVMNETDDMSKINTIAEIEEYFKKKTNQKLILDHDHMVSKRFVATSLPYELKEEKTLSAINNKNILIITDKPQAGIAQNIDTILSAENNVEILRLNKEYNSQTIYRLIKNSADSLNNTVNFVINLQAAIPKAEETVLDTFSNWKSTVSRIYDVLFYSSKLSYENLKANHGYYLSVTNVGHAFGVDSNNIDNPIGGIATGFLKGLEKELRPINVKVLDFDDLSNENFVAETVKNEMMHMGNSIEIAYTDGVRKRIVTVPAKLEQEERVKISKDDTVLVTGGARGITLECTRKLLTETGCGVILTGRTSMPSGNEPWLILSDEELMNYKSTFIREKKVANPDSTLLEIKAQFQRIQHARQLFKNVNDLKRQGFNVKYVTCDFSNQADVAKLSKQLDKKVTVTGIINGAGLPSFGKIPHKNEKLAKNVVDLKAYALFLLQKYFFDKNKIKFVISMGSISGRFGMDGQADYSAGADILVKLSKYMASKNTDVVFKVIGWPAWKSVGMAAVEDVMKVQEGSRGLTYISVEEGQNIFWNELHNVSNAVEYLYFDQLGKENMPLGQLDFMDKSLKFVESEMDAKGNVVQKNYYPLVDQLSNVSRGRYIGTKTLNKKYDAYLSEHYVKGQSVMAGVYHVEAAAEMADLIMKLRKSDGYKVIGVKNFVFNEFVKYFDTNLLSLKYNANVIKEDSKEIIVHVTILSNFVNRSGQILIKDRLHSEGDIILSRAYPNPVQIYDEGNLNASKLTGLDLNRYYDKAKKYIFFGEDFKYLQKAQLLTNENYVQGNFEVGNESVVFKNNLDARTIVSPIFIDNLGRLMLLNEYQQNGLSIVPVGIKSATLFQPISYEDKLIGTAHKLASNSKTVTYAAEASKSGKLVFKVDAMELYALEKVTGEHNFAVKD